VEGFHPFGRVFKLGDKASIHVHVNVGYVECRGCWHFEECEIL